MEQTANTKSTKTPALDKYRQMGAAATIKELGGTDRGAISKAIRYLLALGGSTGEIALIVNKRFQHVRNVKVQVAEQAKRDAAAASKIQNQNQAGAPELKPETEVEAAARIARTAESEPSAPAALPLQTETKNEAPAPAPVVQMTVAKKGFSKK
jgi:hypothetical protein